MTTKFVVCTMLFVFLNIISILLYTSLGKIILQPQIAQELRSVCTVEIINFIYFCLIVFVGVRIFALFIGNNMNDHTLGRLLNPGGYRTKLQVLAVLILIETFSIISFVACLTYKMIQAHEHPPCLIIAVIMLSITCNITTLYFINFQHPDLTGRKHASEVQEYIRRIEQYDDRHI